MSYDKFVTFDSLSASLECGKFINGNVEQAFAGKKIPHAKSNGRVRETF